ncbi:MAG TPA: M13-type metalloendopeptidase [Dermatophilaceae bacterium]|nr:M13-type metalloendopeptidase [Dermatophilaceae bacterium]
MRSGMSSGMRHGMRSGIALEAMDWSVRPQDDLFGYVNGRWLRETAIPDDRGRFGTFDVLRDEADRQLRSLLEEAADSLPAGDGNPRAGNTGTGGSEDEQRLRHQVGALYRSMMDEQRVEELGLTPIEADLAEVDTVTDTAGLWRLLGRLQREGVGGAVNPVISTDDRDSEHYIVYLDQSGLGLPDESYYRLETHSEVRRQYRAHLIRVLKAAGRPGEEAEAVVRLETTLAAAHWDRVANRDAVKTYTRFTLNDLCALAPQIPWRAWRKALAGPATGLDVVVGRQPGYLAALSRAVQDVPLEAWRSWLRWQILRAYAPYLASTQVEENFGFYGRTLTGTPQLRERWKRSTGLVDSLLGEALGQFYVQRHFPADAKHRMQAMVDNIVEAYRRDIAELPWMSPATRERALTKLAAFRAKIGYPDTWRDYRAVLVEPADLVGNVRRANAFDADRQWAKLGTRVDRSEWFMTPQTVNAYYHPGMNEIVFPAALLQPPFFDVAADDAVNYGAIGSVIGHEIGHGFDDQGSRFDGSGNLVDWWTDEDRTAFEALAASLVDQYNRFEPRDLPGHTVNGALTVGENIGDLGGLTIAHLAYLIALDSREAPVLDGLTGDQRFFIGWAQLWKVKARTEESQRLLAIDPHSPGEFRANIVRNLTEFQKTFGVLPGDGLWLPEPERVRIW